MKKFIFSISACLASLIVFWLIIEAVFFPRLLMFLPLNAQSNIHPCIRFLCQSSKRKNFPDKYIAFVGDSYAQGFGDWFLTSKNTFKPLYYSGHIVHKQSNADIVTFGRGGAGNIRGLISEPLAQIQFCRKTLFYKIPDPDKIVVFFYEGNDLNNNLADLKNRFLPYRKFESIFDDQIFNDFVLNIVNKTDDHYKFVEEFSFGSNFLFMDFLINSIRNLNRKQMAYGLKDWKQGRINWAHFNGPTVPLPNHLQSPSLELTDSEIEQGVRIFERSLNYLKKSFPSSEIGVVYIPSVLSVYELVSRKVSIETFEGRADTYKTKFVFERSDDIFKRISEASGKNDVPIIDARPQLRSVAQTYFIHGPRDWYHLNRLGQMALSNCIIELINLLNKF